MRKVLEDMKTKEIVKGILLNRKMLARSCRLALRAGQWNKICTAYYD